MDKFQDPSRPTWDVDKISSKIENRSDHLSWRAVSLLIKWYTHYGILQSSSSYDLNPEKSLFPSSTSLTSQFHPPQNPNWLIKYFHHYYRIRIRSAHSLLEECKIELPIQSSPRWGVSLPSRLATSTLTLIPSIGRKGSLWTTTTETFLLKAK